ncbi:MAG: glutamine-hydrolyzing GMP synthase [Gemmatimonadota bacterium]
MTKGIAVLDFGGQYAHLIANRIRRLHVFAEILPPDAPPDAFAGAEGIILSGGPSSVYAEDRPPFNPDILGLGLPLLGLCYGHQLICHELGGQVRPGETMEFGAASLRVESAAGVLRGLGPRERIWMSHCDTVMALPEGFEVLGTTDDCPIAAMAHHQRRIYGLQFHPEVTHTEHGMQILESFVELCGCARDWTMEGFIDDSMAALKRQVAGRNVFLLVSGGVDSTVCFLLLNRALGAARVLGLHIDNGFMRQGETALVERLLGDSGFANLQVVDASEEFLSRVAGIADPEEKRRRIGEEFVEVRDRVLASLELDPEEWLLGQGTLYTDTIESGGTDHADVIKTHHNRVGVIEQLLAEGKVVEPLSQLYKDEVRELGEKLGLPHHLVWRHPFPGPGLAVRALCADGGPGETIPEAARTAARQLVERSGLDLEVEILPLRSVGVQGDGRTYAHPALLRRREGDAGLLPREADGEGGAVSWDALEEISTELTNEIRAVNRVVVQLGPAARLRQRPVAGYLTRSRLDRLRLADQVVMEGLERHGLMEQVTQMPTVLVPLSSDGAAESLVLRPITTSDFMTARFDRLPAAFLRDVTARLLALAGIEAVYYDVTHKPPGTVEWE